MRETYSTIDVSDHRRSAGATYWATDRPTRKIVSVPTTMVKFACSGLRSHGRHVQQLRQSHPDDHDDTDDDADRPGHVVGPPANQPEQEQPQHAAGKNAGQIPPGVERRETYAIMRSATRDAGCAPEERGQIEHPHRLALGRRAAESSAGRCRKT